MLVSLTSGFLITIYEAVSLKTGPEDRVRIVWILIVSPCPELGKLRSRLGAWCHAAELVPQVRV